MALEDFHYAVYKSKSLEYRIPQVGLGGVQDTKLCHRPVSPPVIPRLVLVFIYLNALILTDIVGFGTPSQTKPPARQTRSYTQVPRSRPPDHEKIKPPPHVPLALSQGGHPDPAPVHPRHRRTPRHRKSKIWKSDDGPRAFQVRHGAGAFLFNMILISIATVF